MVQLKMPNGTGGIGNERHMPQFHLPNFANMSVLAKNATIPFLPGNVIDSSSYSTQFTNNMFTRGCTLEYAGGVSVDKLRSPPRSRDLGLKRGAIRPAWSINSGSRAWTAPCSYSSNLSGERSARNTASYLSRPPQLPAFVTVDKVALRFQCWYKDDLALSTGTDRVLIHKCILPNFLSTRVSS